MKRISFAKAFLLSLSTWTVRVAAVPKTRKLLTTKTLSNGASLSVDIQSPSPDDLIPLDDQCEASATISGEISIGKGAPDVTYIFVLDKSGSLTDDEVDATVDFFKSLTSIVFDDGSALNAGVIFFDSTASIVQDLTDDKSKITAALDTLSDEGGTSCTSGLLEAAKLANDSNAGGTVITLLAGDGECNTDNDGLEAAADALETLGVIVETLAVFNDVDCNGFLGDIPRNGGSCNDIDMPSDYSVTSIIGTTLKGAKVKQDSGSYVDLDTTPSGNQDGPATKTFSVDVSINGQVETESTICIKATGEDALGDIKNVEECITLGVEDDSSPIVTCEPFDKSASDNESNSAGFFEIGGSDNCRVSEYEVVDTGSDEAFGPFPAGTVFKYTRAPGAKPNIRAGSGKTDWRIRGKGDAIVRAMDTDGNYVEAPCVRGQKDH